ncbi:hypothetical protein D3C71_1392120 [compost metagenome]
MLEADQLLLTAGLAVAAHSEVRAETFNAHRQLLTDVAPILEVRLLGANHLADDGQVDHGAFMPVRGAVVGSHPGDIRFLDQVIDRVGLRAFGGAGGEARPQNDSGDIGCH